MAGHDWAAAAGVARFLLPILERRIRSRMYAIDFYGTKPDGTEAGPEKLTFPGDRLPDAITAAHILMQTNQFSWGSATSFKIFEQDLVLVYSSDAAKKAGA
jgi:hypothetical protein